MVNKIDPYHFEKSIIVHFHLNTVSFGMRDTLI